MWWPHLPALSTGWAANTIKNDLTTMARASYEAYARQDRTAIQALIAYDLRFHPSDMSYLLDAVQVGLPPIAGVGPHKKGSRCP